MSVTADWTVSKTICSCLMMAVCAPPALATVIEYDAEGKVTVTEKRTEIAAVRAVGTQAESAASQKLRELTRTVAVRYSGEPGVRKSGLDALTFVNVFEALIAAESNFDPTAVSEKGAKGLGQLMPDTASDMNVSNPFDPHQNLLGSAQYLTGLMLQFGSLDLALAAYNAGPERVKQYKGVPPFPETVAYISDIKKTAGIVADEPQPARTLLPLVPVNKEQPLKGETSVWEF